MIEIALHGQRALVTAGAAGIGRTIADTLVACGATVLVCDIDKGALASLPVRDSALSGVFADVASEEDVDRVFETALKRLGGLDVLVNNAGIAGPTQPIEDVSLADWQRTLAVNLTGQFLCARRSARMFKKQSRGTMINVSSGAGRLGMPLRAPYVASKFGVCGLTLTLAMELGPSNVRVNGVLPGLVDSERAREAITRQAVAAGSTYEEYLPRVLENISLRSAVSAQEVADIVAFLCSNSARHVSGQLIGVCGNLESYRTR